MMSSPCRIAVLGAGAVGGYLGALLSRASSKTNTEIILICRGANLKAISSNGLKLITDNTEILVKPSIVTDDISKIGRIDILLCCVKGYDLEESLRPLIPAITGKTIVIPFLNGVNASERIKNILPVARIWDGCIYVVSRLTAPGIIQQSGTLNQIFFGSDNETEPVLKNVENIFRLSSLNAKYSDTIKLNLWEKYFFISVMATITSYFNTNMGEVKKYPDRFRFIIDLLLELQLVTTACKIILPQDLAEKTFDKIMQLPGETISSMLRDFKKGAETELEDITGYVVNKSHELNISTPVYDMMYNKLRKKANHPHQV
jgi:2-dehydropantoate 2-reductase